MTANSEWEFHGCNVSMDRVFSVLTKYTHYPIRTNVLTLIVGSLKGYLGRRTSSGGSKFDEIWVQASSMRLGCKPKMDQKEQKLHLYTAVNAE